MPSPIIEISGDEMRPTIKALVTGGLIASSLTGIGMTAQAATYQSIALPIDALNVNLTSWSGGDIYAPLFAAGSGTAAGTDVPFVFTQNTGGQNALYEYDAVDVPIGVSGVTSVHTLINSAFGAADTKVGSLTFTFSTNESFSIDLIEGVNIRDHYHGRYVNTVSDPSVTANAFGSPAELSAHLDMQTFAIPLAYQSLTLSKLTFSSTHAGEAGRPVLVALTVVSAVPEVGSAAMALSGLVAGLMLARVRRKNGSAA
jgi:hypothetical protein